MNLKRPIQLLYPLEYSSAGAEDGKNWIKYQIILATGREWIKKY